MGTARTRLHQLQILWLRIASDFVQPHTGLEEVHRGAAAGGGAGAGGEGREELEGLLALVARLDYNGWITGQADYQALVEARA